MDEGGGFDEKTLVLKGGAEDRAEFTVETADKSNPFGAKGFSSHKEITGDATGDQVITCVPVIADEVECSGAFVLDDGDLEIEGTEQAEDDGAAVSAIVGGTGAYEGAVGEVEIDYENDEYTVHLHLPQD
jgi:hypothetical protein